MPRIRTVVLPSDAHVASVSAFVARLQQHGRQVVYVTANRPVSSLIAGFEAAGADPAAVLFLDAVSCLDGGMPERAPNIRYIRSPTMLEMIAMHTEQAASNLEPGHVIIDSLNALSIYNGAMPVQEFSHFLANRLRHRGVKADFMVADNQEGTDLGNLLSSFVDERIERGEVPV